MALFFHWTFCTHQLYSQLFTQMFLSHHDFICLFEKNIFHCFHFVWNISWRHHRGPWGVEKSICPHKVATPEHQLSHKPRGQSGDSIGRSTPRTSILWVALAIKYEIQQTKHSSSPALWFQTQHATLLSLNRVLTMDSSSSTVRRRAWINSSRQWPTLEESEEPLCQLPSASIADDDVFSDGTVTNLTHLLVTTSTNCMEMIK